MKKNEMSLTVDEMMAGARAGNIAFVRDKVYRGSFPDNDVLGALVNALDRRIADIEVEIITLKAHRRAWRTRARAKYARIRHLEATVNYLLAACDEGVASLSVWMNAFGHKLSDDEYKEVERVMEMMNNAIAKTRVRPEAES